MQELEEVIKNRDGAKYISLSQQSLAEKYICSYSTPKEIQADYADLTAFTDINDVKDIIWLPYTNYEIIYYAQDRVVSLKRRGKTVNFYGPALNGEWKDDNSAAEIWFNEFYHIPEGKEELEIIR